MDTRLQGPFLAVPRSAGPPGPHLSSARLPREPPRLGGEGIPSRAHFIPS